MELTITEGTEVKIDLDTIKLLKEKGQAAHMTTVVINDQIITNVKSISIFLSTNDSEGHVHLDLRL